MAGVTYFVQSCPTCGRKLQVRVNYLGKRIVCLNCRAEFAASDPQSAEYPASDSGLTLLARAEQLLEASTQGLPHAAAES